MNPTPEDRAAAAAADAARQVKTVTLLGYILIAVGLVVLTLLKRLPAPIRVLSGLGDVVIGCVLLVLAHQKRKGTLK